MKVELRQVNVHEDMSEETLCFSANIFMNGLEIGTVKNQGHGGCNRYTYGSHESRLMLWDWANSKHVTFESGGATHIVTGAMKLDWVIGELLEKGTR